MKRICIITFILFPLSICSCGTLFSKKATQYFVEGNFLGDSRDSHGILEENIATLSIKCISKDEFEAKKGIDVVEDCNAVDNPYFSISFTIKNEFFHFQEFELRKNDQCWYIDKNHNVLTPEQQLFDDVPNEFYYCISYTVVNGSDETYFNITFDKKIE